VCDERPPVLERRPVRAPARLDPLDCGDGDHAGQRHAPEAVVERLGDPGAIDVFDTASMRALGRVVTEPGAHTTAFQTSGDSLCAFLPATHRAALFKVE
jgi:hypothetical protein